MAQLADLKTVLLSHVINGTYFWPGFLHSPDLHTLNGGSRITKTVDNQGTRRNFPLLMFHHYVVSNELSIFFKEMEVDGAKIMMGESIIAENGVIFPISRVLLPSDGVSD